VHLTVEIVLTLLGVMDLQEHGDGADREQDEHQQHPAPLVVIHGYCPRILRARAMMSSWSSESSPVP